VEKIKFGPLRTDGVAISMTALHFVCFPLTDRWTDFASENGFEKVIATGYNF
jgi:hypothetical protein